jgi:penicillin-binding protein 1A
MTTRERQRRRRHRRSDPARLVLMLVLGIAGVCGLVVMAAVVYVSAVASNIPPLKKLVPIEQHTSSTIYAANGQALGVIEGDSLRTPVPASQIPRILKEATVAIEDQRFYQHGAIDLASIVRAALTDLVTGQAVQGGSTIAMQLARNLYLGDQRTFQRKVKEAVIAERLSASNSKDAILAEYLNTVPYGAVGGQEAYGVGTAARIFFDKPVSKLNLVQSALLAGLPQAPSQYNPFDDPGPAKTRRNEVLAKMAQLHYISATTAAGAEAAPLEIKHSDYFQQRQDNYFFNFISQQLIAKYGANTVEEGGLKVYTTLNPYIQSQAQSAISDVLDDPGDPAAAEVVEDPNNGHILAMAQSGSYSQTQFNYATQGLRQPGSTFKAIVLADALSRGIDPFTTEYLSHTLEAGWLPGYPNYTVTIDGGGDLNAPLDIEQALVASDNTVFAQLAADLGESSVTAMAYKLGVTTHLDSYPAEALGGLTYGVSPLEMANVYSTLADGGWRNKQIYITKVVFPDREGTDNNWGKAKRTKVLPTAAAAVETSILHDNVLGGTATASAINCPTAAKTGTTSNLVDAWLDGYTPNYAAVVWMGYPNADVGMYDVHGQAQYGGDLPAEIWHDSMDDVVTPPCTPLPDPTGMTYVPFTGHFQQIGLNSYVPSVTGPTGVTGHHGAHHHQTGGTPSTPAPATTPGTTTTPSTPTPATPAPNGTGGATGAT